ncbi:SIR2 family NAD-dependent protein deacylase [Plebeiibacterium sediminum]|uniref:protein acetyllysine N-acetyltransferase n=1 Tax=Plebeiibacterium sediminum TaxID=2992112 RepID=A0AAE3M8I3_9BACT|nr:Sir2 family NAD-dependent protein deacetylase [Plebeiobacterium sediminum]MCW3788780.1 NAD-dependent deacylase [Plebeiobacterium sediminum]
MKKLVVFSGAGMSAESGIKTFRDMGGLWEQYDVTKVASPIAWKNTPDLVMDFYNQRRKQLFECIPNEGHQLISKLENFYDVSIITQNVDDLHERAGSSNILHLHGELKKVRSTVDSSLVYEMKDWELKFGDVCEKGSQLRPHIVWFGEAVPVMEEAIHIISKAEIVIVVGTSLNVYPAAGLIDFVSDSVPVYIIDPGKPAYQSKQNIVHIQEIASVGMKKFFEMMDLN